jgi:hypothetical protein
LRSACRGVAPMPRDGYTASVPGAAPVPIIDHGHFSGGEGFLPRRPLGLCGLRVLVASPVSECGEVEAVERYGENVTLTKQPPREPAAGQDRRAAPPPPGRCGDRVDERDDRPRCQEVPLTVIGVL